MTRRYHSSIATATTIPGGTTNVATSIVIAAATGLPATYPYTMVIDDDTTTMEAVEVTNRSGTTLTVTRGVDGTTAQSHSAGATIHHGWTARDLDEPNAWINAGHDHSTTALGGAVPQASVTNLVSDLAAAGGLVLVTAQPFTTSSAVNVNSCLSANYDDYLVLVSHTASSTTGNLNLRLRVGGSDASGANYKYAWHQIDAAGAGGSSGSLGAAEWVLPPSYSDTFVAVTLSSPYKAEPTKQVYHGGGTGASSYYYRDGTGVHALSTSYTGITLYPDAGTITGVVAVYGYK